MFSEFKAPNSKKISVERFAFKENTVYQNNSLKTRNGLKPTDEVLYQTSTSSTAEFKLTDVVHFKNSRYNRLCVHYLALGGFQYMYEFRLVSQTGLITEAGIIQITENESGPRMPMNYYCFSAGATKGCGIYTLINILHSGSKYDMEIYELSSDLSAWLPLGEEDIYIPDYLIDGRGADYLSSIEKLEEPKNKEQLNMLGGVCRCSFTTDGVSSAFYLPVESVIDKPEHIRAFFAADSYSSIQFTFDKGVSVSNQVDYKGYKLTLTYNNGFLHFNSSPAGYIPPRISGFNNNLKVLIKHETEDEYSKKAFMTNASVLSLGGKGEQVVLSGNKKHPAYVMVSDPENPLYFPKNLSFNVGAEKDAIVGIASARDKLAIFKEGSVYLAEIKSNKYLLSLVSNNMGCRVGNSIRSIGRAAIFVGSDSKIYIILSDGTIKNVSNDIKDSLEDFKFISRTCSAVSSERYVLFTDNVGYFLDLKRTDDKFDKPDWYIWTLPPEFELCGMFEYMDKSIFIGMTRDDTYKKYYIYDLSGNSEDIYYKNYDYFMEQHRLPIITAVRTGLINPDNSFSHKMINRAMLYLDNTAITKVGFCNQNGAIIKTSVINISYGRKGKRPIRLYPLIPVVEFKISLESEEPFELSGIELNYYNLD